MLVPRPGFCWCWCPGPGLATLLKVTCIYFHSSQLNQMFGSFWLVLCTIFWVHIQSRFGYNFLFHACVALAYEGKKQTNKQTNKQTKKGAIQSVAWQWNLLASFPNLVNPSICLLVVLNYLVDYTLTAWTSKRSGKSRTWGHSIPVCGTLHWLQYSVHHLHIHDTRAACCERVILALQVSVSTGWDAVTGSSNNSSRVHVRTAVLSTEVLFNGLCPGTGEWTYRTGTRKCDAGKGT